MISFVSFDFVHDKFSISFSHIPTHIAIFIAYITPKLIRWQIFLTIHTSSGVDLVKFAKHVF